MTINHLTSYNCRLQNISVLKAVKFDFLAEVPFSHILKLLLIVP